MFGDRLQGYSVVFAAAALAGFVSSWFLTRVPEPAMVQSGAPVRILALITSPLRDNNFRRLIVFMAAWNAASNIAAPFLAVYLLQQLDYPLSTVTTLWINGVGSRTVYPTKRFSR
jgi:hypothetical protein